MSAEASKNLLRQLAQRFSKLPPHGQNLAIVSGLVVTLYGINKITAVRPKKEEVCIPSLQSHPYTTHTLTLYTSIQELAKHLVKNSPGDKGKKRVALDQKFLEQFKFLLKIVLPSWKSKEAVILFLHTAFLVARTFISIFIAKLDGQIVKSLVDRDGKGFL